MRHRWGIDRAAVSIEKRLDASVLDEIIALEDLSGDDHAVAARVNAGLNARLSSDYATGNFAVSPLEYLAARSQDQEAFSVVGDDVVHAYLQSADFSALTDTCELRIRQCKDEVMGLGLWFRSGGAISAATGREAQVMLGSRLYALIELKPSWLGEAADIARRAGISSASRSEIMLDFLLASDFKDAESRDDLDELASAMYDFAQAINDQYGNAKGEADRALADETLRLAVDEFAVSAVWAEDSYGCCGPPTESTQILLALIDARMKFPDRCDWLESAPADIRGFLTKARIRGADFDIFPNLKTLNVEAGPPVCT